MANHKAFGPAQTRSFRLQIGETHPMRFARRQIESSSNGAAGYFSRSNPGYFPRVLKIAGHSSVNISSG